MKLLTDLPAWAGFSILLLVDALVLSLARAHDQRQNRQYLHAERERMAQWAEDRAEQLAEAKYTDRIIRDRIRNGGDHRERLDQH